jgi:integrase
LLAPVWDVLRKIDTLNRQRKAEIVVIVERDNETLRQHQLHFVFLNSKVACHR